jgi:hypothetical protein
MDKETKVALSRWNSNTSTDEPTQSPTMSPTRSAIVAGFRGSSSGIDCSVFPTRSAA